MLSWHQSNEHLIYAQSRVQGDVSRPLPGSWEATALWEGEVERKRQAVTFRGVFHTVTQSLTQCEKTAACHDFWHQSTPWKLPSPEAGKNQKKRKEKRRGPELLIEQAGCSPALARHLWWQHCHQSTRTSLHQPSHQALQGKCLILQTWPTKCYHLLHVGTNLDTETCFFLSDYRGTNSALTASGFEHRTEREEMNADIHTSPGPRKASRGHCLKLVLIAWSYLTNLDLIPC